MCRIRSRYVTLLFGTVLCSLNSGCSVWMASQAPGVRDLGVLTPGVPRTAVVGELGRPIDTNDHQGHKRDLFDFNQGYSAGHRFGRAAAYIVADAFTIGFWEVIGTPLESTFQGETVRAQVDYDDQERVARVEYFSGAHLRHGRTTLANWMRSSKAEQTAVVGAAPGSYMPELAPPVFGATPTAPSANSQPMIQTAGAVRIDDSGQ